MLRLITSNVQKQRDGLHDLAAELIQIRQDSRKNRMPRSFGDLDFRIRQAERGVLVADRLLRLLSDSPETDADEERDYCFLNTVTKVMFELTSLSRELDKCRTYALGGIDAMGCNQQCQNITEPEIPDPCRIKEGTQLDLD